MRKLTPIDVVGDSAEIHDALNRLFVRYAKLARKKRSNIDTRISGASVSIIVAMQSYFDETKDVNETVAKIDGIFPE